MSSDLPVGEPREPESELKRLPSEITFDGCPDCGRLFNVVPTGVDDLAEDRCRCGFEGEVVAAIYVPASAAAAVGVENDTGRSMADQDTVTGYIFDALVEYFPEARQNPDWWWEIAQTAAKGAADVPDANLLQTLTRVARAERSWRVG